MYLFHFSPPALVVDRSLVFVVVFFFAELSVADRRNKNEIRHLEQELPKWQVLVDSVTGRKCQVLVDSVTDGKCQVLLDSVTGRKCQVLGDHFDR